MHPALSALPWRAHGRTGRLRGNGGNRCCNFCRGCRNFRNRWRLERGCRRLRLRRFGNHRLVFACRRSHWRLNGSSRRRRRNHNHRARSRNRASRRPRHDSARRRTAGNGWRSCGLLGNDRRRLTRLRNNPARLRARRGGSGNRRRGAHGGRRRLRGRGGRFCRHAHVMRLFFLFLLLGQNGLHHIAGLGDVRQIDFGNDAGGAVAGGRTGGMRCRSRFMRKMRANSVRLVAFERTGVRFARRNTKFLKNVENRARLYFQLFREIVDTNLAHPPLFNSVPPNRP